MIKRLLFVCIMVFCALSAGAQKTAILVAQFGTSNTDGRKAAPDVLFHEIQKAYPNMEVREAYTSPTICRILAKRGIHKDNPIEALLKLHLEGYDSVIVQPTFLLDGIEMNLLREDVNRVAGFFKDVKVGTPLLYTIDDFKDMVAILKERIPAKNEALLYVGHGNERASNATYSMLMNMLKSEGISQGYFGTVEGWPDLEHSIAQLAGQKIKKVTLIPFLLSCGVHAHEDIDGEWKPALEKAGYQVEVYFHGLGEMEAVRNLFLKHLLKITK